MMDTDGYDESLGTLTITILYLLMPTLKQHRHSSAVQFGIYSIGLTVRVLAKFCGLIFCVFDWQENM